MPRVLRLALERRRPRPRLRSQAAAPGASRLGVLAELRRAARRWRAEIGGGLGERRDRPDADVLAVEQLAASRASGRAAKTRRELGGERLLVRAYCRSASSGRPSSSQRRAKNFGSSAATVSQRPSAVA